MSGRAGGTHFQRAGERSRDQRFSVRDVGSGELVKVEALQAENNAMFDDIQKMREEMENEEVCGNTQKKHIKKH